MPAPLQIRATPCAARVRRRRGLPVAVVGVRAGINLGAANGTWARILYLPCSLAP